jgi:hypothetical protein
MTAIPNFTLVSLLSKKPALLIPLVPAIAVTKLVVSFEGMALFLLFMFLADLASGLLASYFVWKQSKHYDKWFFGKGEGFSSDKAKKMGIKAAVYLVVPLALVFLQKLLFLKNFKYERLSEAEFEWATVSLIVFCSIEGFSIFHENLPKCGFDLWYKIKKLLQVVTNLKNQIL